MVKEKFCTKVCKAPYKGKKIDDAWCIGVSKGEIKKRERKTLAKFVNFAPKLVRPILGNRN